MIHHSLWPLLELSSSGDPHASCLDRPTADGSHIRRDAVIGFVVERDASPTGPHRVATLAAAYALCQRWLPFLRRSAAAPDPQH
jgi:hypothetical protein